MAERRGFTLIELLVVVGIIMLLLTILVPSMEAAHRRSNRVADLSGLRQLGIALLSMAQDNKGNIAKGERENLSLYDDMAWVNGNTVKSLLDKYGVTKISLSCTSYLNTALYSSQIGVYNGGDTWIGWVYWGSRRKLVPNNRIIVDRNSGSKTGVPYQMPYRLSSPMTTRTLLTCYSYTSNYYWGGLDASYEDRRTWHHTGRRRGALRKSVHLGHEHGVCGRIRTMGPL